MPRKKPAPLITSPAAAVALAQAVEPAVKKLAPGVRPPATAQYSLPELINIHFTGLFPEAGPRPVEGAEGVWENADGTPWIPRERTGGQFSALYLEAQSRFGSKVRGIGLPLLLHDKPHEWPLDQRRGERVVKRYQVIFDFEEEMHQFLEEFKTSNRDPLAMSIAKKTGDSRLYDSAATAPQPRFNNAFSA